MRYYTRTFSIDPNCELLALIAGTTAGVCERIQRIGCASGEIILLDLAYYDIGT